MDSSNAVHKMFILRVLYRMKQETTILPSFIILFCFEDIFKLYLKMEKARLKEFIIFLIIYLFRWHKIWCNVSSEFI